MRSCTALFHIALKPPTPHEYESARRGTRRSIAGFLLGWLIYGIALMNYYEANMVH